MPSRLRKNAVWCINQDVEPQLPTLAITVGTGGQVAYLPPGGLSGNPYATLQGRPLITTEYNETLGTLGDICLVNFDEYAIARKKGLRAASSMHVRFIYHEMAFRFNMRVNGQPKWQSVVTPARGSNTLSPFVALATRA